jgi:predicted transcriptional regulator of viral defense system
MLNIIQLRSDMVYMRPDYQCLYGLATTYSGYFTRAEAGACGYRSDLLSHQTRSGKFRRVYRGVYRLRDFPYSSFEHVVAAWLAVGKERSVVSHETALDIHDLSDVMPLDIHLTVPRSIRNLPKLAGVRIHTSTRPFGPSDVVEREGMRVTSVTRTIVDSAEAGTGPEQIEMAVVQAIDRALTTTSRLRAAASDRSLRVRQLIDQSLELASR